jgi:hypothetical protein
VKHRRGPKTPIPRSCGNSIGACYCISVAQSAAIGKLPMLRPSAHRVSSLGNDRNREMSFFSVQFSPLRTRSRSPRHSCRVPALAPDCFCNLTISASDFYLITRRGGFSSAFDSNQRSNWVLYHDGRLHGQLSLQAAGFLQQCQLLIRRIRTSALNAGKHFYSIHTVGILVSLGLRLALYAAMSDSNGGCSTSAYRCSTRDQMERTVCTVFSILDASSSSTLGSY